jgi:uncharacterized protein (TIGR02646 family)
MIKLTRHPIPRSLKRRASAATQALWDSWHAGVAPIAKLGIYNDPEVKRTLREAQHNKCAYCETPNPSSHGVVEHFRPRDGWRQKRRDPITKPEYFWLAYDWENLLFACDICNDRSHKENLFPLANPTRRATPSNPDIAAEIPLLINPYGPADPEAHITWDRDVPKKSVASSLGEVTSEVLGLDRDDLRADYRRAHFNRLEKHVERVEKLAPGSPERVELAADCLEFLGDDKPWAAMVRANLSARIRAL